MTRKEAIENIKLIRFNAALTNANSFREALVVAIEALSQPSLPSNLDDAAEKYAKGEGLENALGGWEDMSDAFKAGAKWMAGKFQKIEGDLVDWHSTSDGKEYCCGIKTDEAFEIPEGFYIQKKQQPGESLKENEDGNK